jgi:uncharacterized protein (DUF2236 family)
MIGAAHPVNFVGTRVNTRSGARPFLRLARTAKIFETIFFGTRAEADAVLARVARLHAPVRGELDRDEGPAVAGARYSAEDPQLMLWTMAVIADSAPYFYELFVGPLDPGERERLWHEYVSFAELFGMPRSAAPATYPEFRAWFDAYLEGESAHLTDLAREIGRWTAFEIPVPRLRRPGKRLHDLVILGSLPPVVRGHYGLAYSRTQHMAFRALAASVRATRPLTPPRLRYGYNTGSFRLVAATERRRLERGEPTPQAT